MGEKRIKENVEFWDWVFRFVSKPVTHFFVKFTKITPNQITILSFILGLLAAGLILMGDYNYLVVAGVLVLIFMVLDNVDGEIARITKKTSKLGHWLDGVVGFIINEALILAMALSIGSPLSLSVGLLTMIAFPMQYLLIFFYKAEIVKENAPITIGSGSLINKIKS